MKERWKVVDFDEMRTLAIEDPEAFEVRRREVIDAAIARAHPERQQRLRGLQWRIEQVRRRSGTPLAACISLSGMMWESLAGEDGLLETLRKGQSRPVDTPDSAEVVSLLLPPRSS